ncbi:6-pyruvoyl trahydropterin synthase family protein [Deinococcus peraridilitoris]|uniref:6-carboxy-5,6,7,8-tetrahydropterin synthase n=1 Tax=Deinococcus peraridilitoris (strain DSM 19664 / LMG 22246 / CIP 109416 / KR-200) TaxID=937777 RepID=L0A460_DEIPD|nr:6-carboxytetrahydropterin synthase [Deinococcus peraridilitoris]AFZ67815.1 6-pyruvoyl-tetrahydropterin synthase [Deinococcus peraridilitoris DSM 19664]
MPWKLSTEFTFDSAHTIVGYDGPCGRLHGHTYRVRLELQSGRLRPSAHVKRNIMVADYRTLKWAKKDVEAGGLDHAYLNDIAELGDDTTAEVIAQFIHCHTLQRVREALEAGDDGADLQLKVTVWETPDSACEYWE